MDNTTAAPIVTLHRDAHTVTRFTVKIDGRLAGTVGNDGGYVWNALGLHGEQRVQGRTRTHEAAVEALVAWVTGKCRNEVAA